MKEMSKKRGKSTRTNNVVSLMVVPHNSDKVKTWRIRNIQYKMVTLIGLLIVMIVVLTGYLTVIVHQNRQLLKQQNALNSFFEEQQKIVDDNISTIAEVEALDNLTQEKLEEFSHQVQNITKNYIEKEIKTLTVSRSTAASNSSVSFVGKVAELRALLKFLEDTDKKEEKLFSALSEKKTELQRYLDHLPIHWPTEGIIESEFGNRFHPIYKKFMDHTGADIGGKKGNPIYAAASGTVTFAGKNGGYGYVIDIDHGNGIVTRYAHCSKILVKKWQEVKAGDLIAKVGDTGTATGPHLHFEIRVSDIPINPTIFIGTEP